MQKQLEEGVPDGGALPTALDQMILINKQCEASSVSTNIHQNDGQDTGTQIVPPQLPTSTPSNPLPPMVAATSSALLSTASMSLEITHTEISFDEMEVADKVLMSSSGGSQELQSATQTMPSQQTLCARSPKSSSSNSTSEEEVSIEVRRQQNIEASRQFLIDSGFIKDKTNLKKKPHWALNSPEFNKMTKIKAARPKERLKASGTIKKANSPVKSGTLAYMQPPGIHI